MKKQSRLILSIHSVYQIVYEFLDDIAARHFFLIAAGIAFNALLCVFPLLLVALFIVGKLISPSTFLPSLNIFLSTFLPAGHSGSNIATLVVQEIESLFMISNNAGWIGIPALLWTASALLSSFRSGMQTVFGIGPDQSFIHVKIQDLIRTILFIMLVIASTFLHPFSSALEGFLFPYIPDSLLFSGIFVKLTAFISPPLLFLFIYITLPPIKQSKAIIRNSTLIAWFLWELARLIFSWYINYTTSLGIFYGTYVALVIPAIWLYYTAVITLLSAEIGKRTAV